MNPAADKISGIGLERLFTISIPALSFGGIIVAYALEQVKVIADAGTFVWGCVAASFLLGYFAYIKPKKDLVAICTPLYGIILFLIPGDIPHTLLLQLLFAVTVTVLLIRLNRKFGSLADSQGGYQPMERFLHEYIGRIRPEFTGFTQKTAHEIASAFLSFKFGLYPNTIEECRLALSELPERAGTPSLKKALQIVLVNAEDLENSQVTADSSVSFAADEKGFVAINLPPDKIEDPASLELDNALILLYAVAMITSSEDEQALEEHQNYVLKILSSYKAALGIV